MEINVTVSQYVKMAEESESEMHIEATAGGHKIRAKK